MIAKHYALTALSHFIIRIHFSGCLDRWSYPTVQMASKKTQEHTYFIFWNNNQDN